MPYSSIVQNSEKPNTMMISVVLAFLNSIIP